MNEIWKSKGLIKYGIFAHWTSIGIFVILANSLETQFNVNSIIGTVIIFILQLQRFLKIVRLSVSNDKIMEKRDRIFFTIVIILMLAYILITRSVLSIYISLYAIIFIIYMISFSKNPIVASFMFVGSLIPLELIIISNGIFNGKFIIGNLSIFICEILTIVKIRKLAIERKIEYGD